MSAKLSKSFDSGKPSAYEKPDVPPAPLAFTPQTVKLVSLSLLLALVFIALLLILKTRRLTSRGNALILVGPPDSGKTAILSTLIYGQSLHTHTSLQTNSSTLALPERKKTIRVVDIPGHPRIRDQFREHLDDAKAIIFVVDASTISRNGAAVAEHLHHIFHSVVSLPPSHTPPSLLILAHKVDLLKTTSSMTPDANAITRVRNVLERELEKRRVAQSGDVGVEGLGEEGGQFEMGGLDRGSGRKGDFRFDDWEGGDITFIGSSLRFGKEVEDPEKGAQEGLLSFRNWLEENM
ncbi:P-loop containing nucleoside triphosphate hydrolase protein [Tricholoma matsutake]|nr:P-loop containing nucleoside triphosphate hydrolase protein [Tricholoma matsutake 945]